MALTRHGEGSFRELLTIAFPLVLTSLSMTLMIFVDRLLLARYSTEAICAAANATTLGWAFIVGFAALTGIAEVFVAQLNGAGDEARLGEPIWQMIYVALISWLFFLPISLWGGQLFFRDSFARMENDYFSVMILFGPAHCAYTALAGFWIGRGKIATITYLAVGANILNVVLDTLLIFGVEGLIQPMGTKGAAIATSIGIVVQALVLLGLFLKRAYRQRFGSARMKFNPSLLLKCLRVGLPNAFFDMLEVFAWALFYFMMTYVSSIHITVAAIIQSLAIIFFAVADAMYKAASTVAGNMIGAGRSHNVKKVLKSGTKLLIVFYSFSFVLLYLMGWDRIIDLFLDVNQYPNPAAMRQTLRVCLQLIMVYNFFESLRMMISGLLTAAADTLFILIGGTLSIWIGLLAPIELFIVKGGGSPTMASVLCTAYAAATALVFYLRFRSGKWRRFAALTGQPTTA